MKGMVEGGRVEERNERGRDGTEQGRREGERRGGSEEGREQISEGD